MRIILVDSNNHDPVFMQPVYYFSITENNNSPMERTGSRIGQVSATDVDMGLNGQITYSITSRNAQGLFTIAEVKLGISRCKNFNRDRPANN